MSDTMNADDIHHAGAKALAAWAEENLGPLSFGPQAGLLDQYRQMQAERVHPNREAANESCISSGRQYVPRPSPDDHSNQISADVIRGREIRLGFTMPDSQCGDDEVYAQDATLNIEYCNFNKAAANLWRARSCLREAAHCMTETGYIHPQMAAAIAATERLKGFATFFGQPTAMPGWARIVSMTSWAETCSVDTMHGGLPSKQRTILSS